MNWDSLKRRMLTGRTLFLAIVVLTGLLEDSRVGHCAAVGVGGHRAVRNLHRSDLRPAVSGTVCGMGDRCDGVYR